MPVTTAAATKKAQAEIARLQALKKELTRKLTGTVSNDKLNELNSQIREIDASIEQLSQDTSQVATPSSQLTKSSGTGGGVTAESVEDGANTLIDAALRVFGTMRDHDFIKFEGREKIIPLVAGVAGIDVGLQGGVKIEATAQRYNRGIEVQGALKGSIEPNIGLGVGIDLYILGSYKLAGGIQGGAAASASVSFMLDVHNRALRASVRPFSMKIEMVAKLYLVIPFISETFIGYAKALNSNIDADGSRLTYQFGSVDIFTITTPTYSMTFTPSTGHFTYTSSADFSITVNQRIKDAINALIDAIKNAARQVGNALNPVRQAENIINWVDDLL